MKDARTERGVNIQMKINFKKLIYERNVIFDGGMGTQLHSRGIKTGEMPEIFGVDNPEIIKDIHRAYMKAGADVITTNTFGANRLKLCGKKYTVCEVIECAVGCAKEVAGENGYVALDIGPLGELIAPMGTLSREDAYDIFKEQMVCGEKAGADLIIIETMTDLAEMRCALLAAKENTSLPIVATMSFESGARTFTGCGAKSFALAAAPFADALGINCSLGPKEILPIAEKIAEVSAVPVIVQPNAGLPKVVDGETVFNVTPEEFAEFGRDFLKLGVRLFGGCCGTTPGHIRLLADKVKNEPLCKRAITEKTRICSAISYTEADRTLVIGERINPTGKKLFKEALVNHDIDYILRQGIEQANAGADILDVNVGLPSINEKEMMVEVVTQLQSVCPLPLQIDSSNPEVIEAALRVYDGKAIVNSVNGEQKSLDSILPLIKKYGACVVGLTLDENGIPSKAGDRLKIAEKILDAARGYGIPDRDVLIDCLTLTVSAQQEDACETLKSVRLVKEKLGLKTVLGVSNISFGLPRRDIINESFLAQAFASGLDMPILNPNADGMMKVVYAHRVLSAQDIGAAEYIEKYGEAVENTVTEKGTDDITEIIIRGLKDEAKAAARKLLESMSELELVDKYLIPALDIVGERYEKGIIFLPQLIGAAETVKQAFDVIKERLSSNGDKISKGKIVLATVKGDIHDIGKNIVKVILENYGYTVNDLGRDVAPEKVLDAVKSDNIKLVGLSALMTTTVKSMETTIKLIKNECPDTKIMVGGAVLTEDYATQIGADYYAKDAKMGVSIAKQIFDGEK